MDIVKAIIVAIVEGLTEYLPISSTAHMGFTAALLGMEETEYLKMFQVSIQFGAILSIVVLYWKKFFDFSNFNFYIKLACAVVPALILGKLFDDKIEAVLGNQIVISCVLVLGGVVLLFVDKWFDNKEKIDDEKGISIKKAVTIGFWQCLAMMPGTSRSAASIKTWGEGTPNAQKGYEMILASTENIMVFIIGNIVAFIVAMIAVKTFINVLAKYGFKFWGWYRIIVGIVLLIYFYLNK